VAGARAVQTRTVQEGEHAVQKRRDSLPHRKSMAAKGKGGKTEKSFNKQMSRRFHEHKRRATGWRQERSIIIGDYKPVLVEVGTPGKGGRVWPEHNEKDSGISLAHREGLHTKKGRKG